MARQELLDIALDDIRTQEDVEIVWQWIQNSLVSLQLAFRTLPAETVSNEIGNVFLDDQEILYKGTTSDEYTYTPFELEDGLTQTQAMNNVAA